MGASEERHEPVAREFPGFMGEPQPFHPWFIPENIRDVARNRADDQRGPYGVGH